MTAEKILQSDILDIIFEGRNKLYGAYELRRTYHSRIKRGLGGMVLLMALLTGGYLFSLGRQNNTMALFDIKDTLTVKMIQDPKKPLKEEPAVSKPELQQKLATVKENIPIIQPDELVPKTEVNKQDVIDTSVISNVTNPGLGSTPGDVVSEGQPGDGKPNGAGTEDAPATEPARPTGPVDMNMVDEMPQYPGGTKALVNYMVRNLTSELEPGVKYVVKAQFVINEEGAVSDAVILHSDDVNLNSQVLKAIRKMVKWKPGQLHGQKVSVRFTMPVTFVGAEE